jgi:spore germination cell wall hydrolase CwlJ-like protein
MSKLRKVANTVIGLMFLSGGVAAAGTDNGNSKATQAFDAIEFVAQSIQPTYVDPKELRCLARNIFFESRGEPRAGKVAVGVVTLNRVEDPRFPNTVCGVVKQKTVIRKPRQITHTETIGVGFFRAPEVRTRTETVFDKKIVCQFSWVCEGTRRIRETDAAWTESVTIAQRLLTGEYSQYRTDMSNWLYFHANYVNPKWHNLKREARIGAHVFYVERTRHK